MLVKFKDVPDLANERFRRTKLCKGYGVECLIWPAYIGEQYVIVWISKPGLIALDSESYVANNANLTQALIKHKDELEAQANICFADGWNDLIVGIDGYHAWY